MMLTYVLTFLGGVFAVILATLCTASGLFYAAELAEENSVITGKILKWAMNIVLATHVLLFLDGGIPRFSCFIGFICHLAYVFLLIDYPRIEAASPAAACSMIALLIDHFIWFKFLMSPEAIQLPILNAIGLFILLVWLIPIGCFLSLSINDLALPIGSTNTELRSTSLFRYLTQSVSSFVTVRFKSFHNDVSAFRHNKRY
mmetsp:Transcript_1002/g.1256  ORF Transcript_1002/g.1256 Transcript_1002/m.1256 type:complete len:201 (-) Transcript_1002:316-918(-)